MLSESVIKGHRKCLNCLYPKESSKTLTDMGLYYCHVHKGGHAIMLNEKACRKWEAIVPNFDIKLKLIRQNVLFYCIDQDENVWAFSKTDDCCLIKALNNIRKSFLIEKFQLELFEKDGDPSMLVRISEIKIGKRMRKLDENKVKELMESIAEIGLINSIAIDAKDNLLAGAHRLEACRRLGHKEIMASVIMKGESSLPIYRLIEIDENLIRSELTALERADHLAERKRHYEILHPETKQGQAQASAMNKKDDNLTAENAVTFTKDASEKTGLAERTIREDVQLSNSLSEEAKKIITGTWIEDKKTYLMEIGKLCPESQVQVAKRLIEFPALSLDWAVKKIEAERYGLHLSYTFLINLEKSTLHLYNSGLPIDEQKRVVNLVVSAGYPPFIIDDLYNISHKQDDLVNEVVGIGKSQEDVKLTGDLCAKAKEIIAGSSLENKKSYLVEIAKLLGYQQVSIAQMLIANPEWDIETAKKRIFAVDIGFKLDEYGKIILQESTLHEWNNGLPVEKQRQIIRNMVSRKYPPFIIDDLYNISGKQDDLVNEVLGIEKNQEDSTSQLAEKELIELGVKMPKSNDKKIVPVMILPDGNKRILSHLADNTFLSALVNKEMLDRVDICLNDNDAILIRRVGNLLSVSKASINSERFIEELNKSFEQINAAG